MLVSLVATFYWYSLGPRGHDDEASSTSEDEGYPEDMDQDKHDDSTDDSDSDRTDADSEGEELMHHDDNAEREGGEDKKSGKLHRKVEIHLLPFSPNLHSLFYPYSSPVRKGYAVRLKGVTCPRPFFELHCWVDMYIYTYIFEKMEK